MLLRHKWEEKKKMQYKDYYKVLGVDKSATEQEIKKSYRRLARQHHPDQNPNNKSAEERFKEINEAYEVLGDSEKRVKYDQLGTNYHQWQQRGGDPRGFDFSQWANQSGRGRTQNINVEDLFGSNSGGFSDFFRTMFADSGGMGGFSSSQSVRQDSEQTIEISLEEAYHGGSRTLVDATGERFAVKIPKGAKTGTKVRLKGKGQNGADLYLVMKERLHPIFERDEEHPDDLRREIRVDLLTAVLGGEVRVETLKGAVNLKIAPGTQGGIELRLKGRGMPNLKESEPHGNLYVTVQIDIPTSLSNEERELYEQLRKIRHP